MTWTIKEAQHVCKLPTKGDAELAGVSPKEGDIWTCDDCGRRYRLEIYLEYHPDKPSEQRWAFKQLKDN